MVKAKEEVIEKERIIACVTGPSGAGKTFFVCSIPDALIYDTDLGGGGKYMDPWIKKVRSERITIASFPDLLEDLKARARAGTLKRTVVIDHVTALHQESVLRHAPKDEKNDFGNSTKKATHEWRRIREFVKTLDCNLIVTAHIKGEWKMGEQVGMTTDAGTNIEGDVSTVLYLLHPKGASYPSVAQVVKWRRHPEDPRGKVPTTFPFTIEVFEKIAGPDWEREREDIRLASPEQVAKLKVLLEVVRIPDEAISKWMKNCGIDDVADATEDQILKLTKFVEDKLPKEQREAKA